MEITSYFTPVYLCYTEPPSAPRLLRMVIRSNGIILFWLPSAETGGRSDLYFKVEYSDPDNISNFSASYTTSTLYVIFGLRPYTSYCIRVSAHNGVSDQDSDRSQIRMVVVCTRTDEGSKSRELV